MSKNKLETVAQTQRKKIKSMDVFLHNTHTSVYTADVCSSIAYLLVILVRWQADSLFPAKRAASSP